MDDFRHSCVGGTEHFWSIARSDGRQECLVCHASRYLPVIDFETESEDDDE